MRHIIWTDPATDDMRQIWKFIAKDSIEYADKFINDFFDVVKSFKRFPNKGRPYDIDKYGKDCRLKVISNYNVIYDIKDNAIYIITVVHTSRDNKAIQNAIRNYKLLKI